MLGRKMHKMDVRLEDFNSRDIWLTPSKKRKLRKEARVAEYPSMTENRKDKRNLRKSLRNGDLSHTINQANITKPGKLISSLFNSSRRYTKAYTLARHEEKFHYDAMFADY